MLIKNAKLILDKDVLQTMESQMFGLRKRAEDPISLVHPEKPIPVPLTHGVNPLGTYEELAKELGFFPAQLFDEQLLRFLNKENMPIYDYEKVDAYMTALARVAEKNWGWRPLREKDKPKDWGWSGRLESIKDKYFSYGGYYAACYDKAVPIRILRQVKKIQGEFGDRAFFFVSDYSVPVPDPFIMVTTEFAQRIVFGVWDEPGFGDE